MSDDVRRDEVLQHVRKTAETVSEVKRGEAR